MGKALPTGAWLLGAEVTGFGAETLAVWVELGPALGAELIFFGTEETEEGVGLVG